MIGRLLNGAWTILVYACVGTIISQAIVLLILAATWKIDQKRWLTAVAALQGIGPAETAQLPEREADKTAPEQPSYEQILEARTVKFRDLELRESEMRNSLSQIQFEQTKLDIDNLKIICIYMYEFANSNEAGSIFQNSHSFIPNKLHISN